jgi:hypothetical protein
MVVGVEAPLLKRERSSFTRLVSSDGLAGLPFTTNPIKSPESTGLIGIALTVTSASSMAARQRLLKSALLFMDDIVLFGGAFSHSASE